MRLPVMVLALTLTCAAAAVAAETCPPGTTPATQGAGAQPNVQRVGNEVYDTCLARAFGITCGQLSQFRAQGLTNSDIAIASAIARKSAQPLQQVINQYALTKNWQAVSDYYQVNYQNLGLSQDLLNPDEVAFNTAFISQQYNIPASDIQALQSQGYSWGEISMIANAASRTGLSFQQVATLRSQGKTWEQIATSNNLRPDSLLNPCPVIAPRVLSCAAACAAGPVCTRPVSPVMLDLNGNVLLTEQEALTYYARGNDWINVAIAANISRLTGYPIDQVLTDLRSGAVWEQVALMYGVDCHQAFDVSCYPFPRVTVYSQGAEQKNLDKIAPYQSVPFATPAAPAPQPGTYVPTTTVPSAPVTPSPILTPAPTNTPGPVLVPSPDATGTPAE